MRLTRPTTGIAFLLAASVALSQPPGITMEMINTTLPLEGAPEAVSGDYSVVVEDAFGAPGLQVFRPGALTAFPDNDSLPVLVWGNGGCAINATTFSEFLTTIASHGILVVTTQAIEGEPQRQQTRADMLAGIDWAERENTRQGAALAGKIDTAHVAVMGQSCGGMLSVGAGTDPRVDTIGVFNSGVSAPVANPQGPVRATTDDLMRIHGPALYINGGERDFMLDSSRANFDMIDHVPAFYGAREGAGHLATITHPGGGEWANIASNWLLFNFKGDGQAGNMFTSSECSLCTAPGWDTDAKGL